MECSNVERKQKIRRKKKKKGKREDRISKLPEAVLQHILSFLPTKCTVCTSVLSKRWRNVWTGVPALSFLDWPCFAPKEKHLLEVERLLNFMDKWLPVQQDTMADIHKFYLHLPGLVSYESKVNAWITTLVSCKLEELTLVAFMGQVSLFPPSFFTSKSLTTLDLKMYIDFKPPGLVCLPRLKILLLTYIKFKDIDSTSKFFSGCPVLEQLSLDKCSWTGVVSILTPALKYLSITNYSGTPHLDGSTVKINAPNLVSLNYVETVEKNSDISSWTSLVDSDIDFPYLYQQYPERRGEICSRTAKLLAGLSNVKLLKLSGETFEALSLSDDRLANLTSFNNLIRLEVSSAMRCLSFRALFDLLQTSHNLKSLVFAGDFNGTSPFHHDVDDNGDGLIQSLMGQCMLLHLESVEFKKFNGHPRELDVLKLFSRNAVVLKRLIIEDSSCSRDKKKVMQQLQNIPRSSKNCVVKFSTSSCVSYLYK